MASKRFLWLFVVTLSVVSCGISESVKTPKSLPIVEADPNLLLEMVSGDGQTQRIGKVLVEPLTVRARDIAGKPGADQPVQFDVVAGDATLLGRNIVRTDENGVASMSVQLGSQTVPVSISARLPVVNFDERKHLVVFSAVAVPVPHPTLYIGNPQSNGQRGIVNTDLPLHLSVVARDEDGNGVSGQTIRYTIVTGSPSVGITPDVTTGDDGTASSALSLGTVAGDIEVRATWLPDPDNDPSRSITFHATAEPAEPAVLAFVSGHLNGDEPPCTGETEEFSAPLVVRLLDQFGNRVAGQNIKIQPGPDLAVVGSAIGVPVLVPTDTTGQVSFRLLAGTVNSGYSRETAISATTILSQGIEGPSASARLNYTRHRYLEVGEGSSIWNYGTSGVYIPPNSSFLMYLKYPVVLWARTRCWAPLANVSIEASYVNKYSMDADFCPSPDLSWPGSETLQGPFQADASGHFAATMLAPVYTTTMHWVATRLQLVAKPAEGETNTVYFYSGPKECQ